MKRLLSILLLFAGTVSANPYLGILSGSVAAGGQTFLINQGFEGTGTDNGETWTGGFDRDYTTAPAPLVGSESAREATATTMTSPTFAGQSELWVYFQIHYTARADNVNIFEIRNSTPATIATVATRPSNKVRVTCGVNSVETGGTFVSGTTYHVWVHYIKGTGGDATMSVGFSTDGTRPTSGDNFVGVTTGTATTDAAIIRFVSTAATDVVVDRILASSSVIGDNP